MQGSAVAITSKAEFRLKNRIVVIVAALVGEKLLVSAFVDIDRADAATGWGEVFRVAQHWGLRFAIAFVAALALLAFLRGPEAFEPAESDLQMAAVRPRWALCHALCVLFLLPLSYSAFRAGVSDRQSLAIMILGSLFATLAVATAFLALAPLAAWRIAAASLGTLWGYALGIGLASVTGGLLAQALWVPSASATFQSVYAVLHPLLPSLEADSDTRILSTDRFAVVIFETCSGLEGMALMLAFLTGWLLLYRREYRFPAALWLLPIGVALMFVLNVLRIAALILIGDAGYPEVAKHGFHSQAGWIAFILAACGLVLLSRRLRVFGAAPRTALAGLPVANPAVPFVLPLFLLLLTGMLTHAISNGFEDGYPVRLWVGALALWCVRRPLAALDWRFGVRGVFAGVAVFAIWMLAAAWLVPKAAAPAGLAALTPGARVVWIACRVLASVVTVPLAEELAYRGYLMRRLTQEQFESLPFERTGGFALLLTAIVFGLGHAALWPAGIVAGLVYGGILVKSGRMGEAVVAHATTNALVVIAVLAYGRWELW